MNPKLEVILENTFAPKRYYPRHEIITMLEKAFAAGQECSVSSASPRTDYDFDEAYESYMEETKSVPNRRSMIAFARMCVAHNKLGERQKGRQEVFDYLKKDHLEFCKKPEPCYCDDKELWKELKEKFGVK